MARTDRLTEITRRRMLQGGAIAIASAGVFAPMISRAAPAVIRFANGGAIAPNEIETLMPAEFFQKEVLKNYGKEYDLEGDLHARYARSRGADGRRTRADHRLPVLPDLRGIGAERRGARRHVDHRRRVSGRA